MLRRPTAYEILGVHPLAPSDLINAAYWMTVDQIQAARQADVNVDQALYVLTRAYENVANPEVRAGYNVSIGYRGESLVRRRLPARRRWPLARESVSLDHYEVLGLHPSAPFELVDVAHRVLRSLYLRPQLDIDDERREKLVELVDRAYDVLIDDLKRSRYDESREVRAVPATRATAVRFAEKAWRVASRLLGQRPKSSDLQPTMLARLQGYLGDPGTVPGAG